MFPLLTTLSLSASPSTCSPTSQPASESLNMQELTRFQSQPPEAITPIDSSKTAADFNFVSANSNHLLGNSTSECSTIEEAIPPLPCLNGDMVEEITASQDNDSAGNREMGITDVTTNSTSNSFSSSSPPSSSLQNVLLSPTEMPSAPFQHPFYLNKTSNEATSFTFKKPPPRIHCAKVIYFKPRPRPSSAGPTATKLAAPSYVPSHAPIPGHEGPVISVSAFPPAALTSASHVHIDVSLAMTVTDLYHPVMYDHPYCNSSSFV